MKTPTHALIGYGCARLFGWTGRLRTALMIGAVAPDLPVAVVWSWIAASVTWRDGRVHQPAIQVEMDRVYFADSWVSALHSLLHSPVSLAVLALAAWGWGRYRGRRPWPALAFLVGALTHSLTDILTHVTDGPLLLWPLETTIRLGGPVSHWDPAHGGLWISGLEAAAGAATALVWVWKRAGAGRRRGPAPRSTPSPPTSTSRRTATSP